MDMHMGMRVRLHVPIHMCMYMYMHPCMQTYTCSWVCMHIYISRRAVPRGPRPLCLRIVHTKLCV